MKCIKCEQEMVNISGGNYQCPSCGQTINDLVYRGTTATIPFNPNDYQIAIRCMICGKEVVRTNRLPVDVAELIKVCDDCKKAIAWAKENMKEKENENNK